MQNVRMLMRRKAFRTFFVSFICAFLVPVLVLARVVFTLSENVERDLQISAQLALEQIRAGIDGRLYAVMRTADSILLDDKSLYFAERDDPMRTLNNLTSFQMLRSLTQQVGLLSVAYSDIDQCYLYLPRSGKVISNTITDASDFYARKLTGAFASEAEWRGMLTSRPDGFYNNGSVYYVRTLTRGEAPLLTVVVSLQRAALGDLTPLAQNDDLEATVYSASGEPLLYTGDALPPPPGFLYKDRETFELVPVSEGSVHVNVVKSPQTGCIYQTVEPMFAFDRPLRLLRWISGFGGAALLLFGLLLSMWLARRQYQPILALRDALEKSGGGAAHGDDFRYLSEMLDALHNENRTAAEQARETAEKLEDFALERLLKGMYASAGAMEEELLRHNVALCADRFAVAGIAMDDGDGFAALRPENRELVRFVAVNVFDELLSAYSVHCATFDGQIWLLLSLEPDGRDWRADAERSLSEARRFLSEHFGLRLTISVSDEAAGLEGVHGAYRAALALLRQDGGRGDLRRAYTPDAKTEEGKQPPESAAMPVYAEAQQLARLLLDGDTDAAAALLAAVNERLAELPRANARLHWNAMLGVMLPALEARAGDDLPALTERVRAFVEMPPLGDDFAAMRALCAYVAALPQIAAGRGVDVAQRAAAFIEANYAACGLSIAEVAAHLNLTASYASALYKKQAGEPMLDTINRVRLRHAKALLSDTALPLEEVAARTGYYSNSTFLRAFRRHEGITPGQYRAMARSGRVEQQSNRVN